MTTQALPIAPNLARQRFTAVLEGRRYGVELEWCYNPEGWFLTLTQADVDRAPILRRVPLQPDTWLLHGIVSDARPPGELYVVGATAPPQNSEDILLGIQPEPTVPYEALGVSVRVVYVPAADIRTFIAGL